MRTRPTCARTHGSGVGQRGARVLTAPESVGNTRRCAVATPENPRLATDMAAVFPYGYTPQRRNQTTLPSFAEERGTRNGSQDHVLPT